MCKKEIVFSHLASRPICICTYPIRFIRNITSHHITSHWIRRLDDIV